MVLKSLIYTPDSSLTTKNWILQSGHFQSSERLFTYVDLNPELEYNSHKSSNGKTMTIEDAKVSMGINLTGLGYWRKRPYTKKSRQRLQEGVFDSLKEELSQNQRMILTLPITQITQSECISSHLFICLSVYRPGW